VGEVEHQKGRKPNSEIVDVAAASVVVVAAAAAVDVVAVATSSVGAVVVAAALLGVALERPKRLSWAEKVEPEQPEIAVVEYLKELALKECVA
jgi:hypothetical protein